METNAATQGPRARRTGSVIAALAAAALVVVIVFVVQSTSTNHDDACADVTVIFARGSGQELDFREAPRFFEQVTNRLDGVAVNIYELGTAKHGGAQYPARGAGFDDVQSIGDLIGAITSWADSTNDDYEESVTAGVDELTAYLSARAVECPDEVFTIGGYSQGAQVVGEALPALSTSVRDRIAFVALFGDPKLYLPEGAGALPPACDQGQTSEWRRGSVSCFTDNGILDARTPYLPADIESRVGSWCDRNDPICNDNLLDFAASAHQLYADGGAEIDEAAREAAAAIAVRLPQ